MESHLHRAIAQFIDYINQTFGTRIRPPVGIAPVALIALLLLSLIWLASGVFQIEEGSGGAVMRFGQFVRTAGPGLNYHLPYPFETVIKEKISYSRRVEIGYRSGLDEEMRYVPEESNILTSDENIVRLKCDVTWHIEDLPSFVFNIRDMNAAIRHIAQSAVREVISETPISDILSNKKQEIGNKIEILTQRIVDNYRAGIRIEKVHLLAAEPPAEVIESYRDVQSSRADKEREINQAQAYWNDTVTRAKGEVTKIIQNAEGLSQESVSHAMGDTKRFEEVLVQYRRSKDITKRRIYLETMEQLFSGNQKIVVDSKVLPHLPLGSSSRKNFALPDVHQSGEKLIINKN
jgi:membrane protease subunit HflK